MKKSIPIDEITLRRLIESLQINIQNGEVDGTYIVSLNADNITVGSIAAARMATTALNADNITAGTIVGRRFELKDTSGNIVVLLDPNG